ncbi:hypothetical protein GCM10009623_36710 [Nocardioides aestuarii]|uniref:Uncharacterized protein n=1 Tax=Nocardioides aestuarii TaxID=252231 RepID=A0ABW4TSJ1_9ACTN
MTGLIVKRAWLLTALFWAIGVTTNLLLVVSGGDVRALLIIRGLAAALMLTGLAMSGVLTLWWLVTRRRTG